SFAARRIGMRFFLSRERRRSGGLDNWPGHPIRPASVSCRQALSATETNKILHARNRLAHLLSYLIHPTANRLNRRIPNRFQLASCLGASTDSVQQLPWKVLQRPVNPLTKKLRHSRSDSLCVGARVIARTGRTFSSCIHIWQTRNPLA